MPNDDASALRSLRRALALAVDRSSLRNVAREVGMSPTGIRELIDGRWERLYGATRRKLERWYLTARRRAEKAADDEFAEIAIDALARAIPGPEGPAFRAYVTAARNAASAGEPWALQRCALTCLLGNDRADLWQGSLDALAEASAGNGLDTPPWLADLKEPRAREESGARVAH